MIILDLDGVLANFVQGAIDTHGLPITHEQVKEYNFWDAFDLTNEEFWRAIEGVEFWENLKPYPWAYELVAMSGKDVLFSTSPTLDPYSVAGKLKWLNTHFGVSTHQCMIGPRKELLAHPRRILIDDYPKNIARFSNCGGVAVLFPQPWNNSSFTLDDIMEIAKRHAI